MNIEHQYDCKGHHRVVVDGQAGEPTTYEHPAFLQKDGKWYMALSPYYEGVVPHDMVEGVFELTQVVSKNATGPVVYNMFAEDEPCPWIAKQIPCSLTNCPEKEVSNG